MSNDKIRGEFEAWATTSGKGKEITSGLIQTCMGIYVHGITQTIWVGWRAAQSQSEPVCGMCNGHGMIGGFVNAENGFESNPCPECAVEPVQVSQPVGYFAQLNTGEYIQLLDPQDISEVTPLYTSPPDYQATATAYAQAVDQVIALQNENEALKAENKELKKDVDCCTSANISFKRIKTNLQAENEALRKHLLQAHQAATVEAKIADEFRAECDVLRQRVAELKDILTSARSIAKRRGVDTAWDTFDRRIERAGIGHITAKNFRGYKE
jgi:hypothetical protein